MQRQYCLPISFLVAAVLASLVAVGSQLDAETQIEQPERPPREYLQGTDAGKVIIFGTQWCPYCNRVKKALETKNVPFSFIDIGKTRDLRRTLTADTGQSSVPFVFVRGRFIGGCNDGPVNKCGSI
jgi:glutaredoxin 3